MSEQHQNAAIEEPEAPRPPEQPDLPRPPERPDLPLPPDDPGPEPTPGGGSVRPGGSPSESPGVDSPLKD